MSSFFSTPSRRDLVWQTERVRAVCQDVAALGRSSCARRSASGLRPSASDDWDLLLEKFAVARARILDREEREPGCRQVLYGSAREVLERVAVTPQRSRLGFLYGELWSGLSEFYRRREQDFLQHWYAALAGGESQAPAIAESSAVNAAAHFALLGVEADPDAAGLWEKRLRGFALQALGESRLQTNSRLAEWEAALVDAQLTQDFSPIAILVRGQAHKLGVGQLLLARLWAWANPQKNAPRAIDAVFAKLSSAKIPPALLPAWELCTGIERAYRDRTALHIRIDDLGQAAARLAELPSPEFRAVGYLAVARALARLKKNELVPICLARYEQLSLAVTEGLTNDVFSYAETFRLLRGRKGRPSHLTQGCLPRFGKLGYASLEAARILGPARLAKLARGDFKNIELEREEMRAIAKGVGDCLAELRGPLAKLGQLFGHYLGVIDHPLGEALSVLHARNTPVPFAAIQSLLEHEYGQPLTRVFKRIEAEPVGVGTVAQVHRATTLSGEEIALKVKMPGIDRVFADDLRLFGTLAPILKMLLPHIDFKGLYREIRGGLLKELDFDRERRMQEELAAMFVGDDDIAIPKLHPEFCTPSVIALDFVDGVEFTRFAETAEQSERDRMGRATVRFVVTSMLRGCFNSDPNPGNFLYSRGKAYFIDFGAVQELTRAQRVASALLIRSVLDEDLESYKIAARQVGFVSNSKTFDYESTFAAMTSERMGMWAVNRVHTIDMGKLIDSFLNTTGVGRKPAMAKHTPKRGRPPYAFPVDYFFFFREYFGHLLLLSVLRARANWHELVRELTERHGLPYP